MRVYTLHYPTNADLLSEDPVLVNEGFNWQAAFFTSLWALWGGMWLAALLIFAAAVGLQLVLELVGAGRSVQLVAGIGLSAIVGFCANDWQRANLHRRGYRFQGVVAAPDKDTARRRWFSEHPVS